MLKGYIRRANYIMSTYLDSEIAILKGCALKQHNGEDFFILYNEDDEIIAAYEGTEEDAKEQFRADIEGTEELEIDVNFEVFCSNNLTEVTPIDGDEECENHMVLTDDEADEKWDDYLDSYIAECIQPEIDKLELGNLSCYVKLDEEAWKRDAKMDGRGHSLASYDGHENEETVEGETFYIYRIN